MAEAATFNWTQPNTALSWTPPDDLKPESERDAEFYAQYVRWIVANFYNQARPSFYPNVDAPMGMAAEAKENWSYVFGEQNNYAFKYMETDAKGQTVQAVWRPGQKITSLVNDIRGRMLDSIDMLTPSVVNDSRNVVSKRSDIYEKLMVQYDLKQAISLALPQEVGEFAPVDTGSMQMESEDDIEEYTTSWNDEYSIMAVNIARSQINADRLKYKLLSDFTHQVTGGLSGMLIDVQSGRVINTPIATYEAIWDNRVDDDLNRYAQLSGYVKHNVPYQDVLRMFREYLSDEQMREIRDLAVCSQNSVQDFFNFYNAGYSNTGIMWWNRTGFNQMTVSYGTCYWLMPRKFPFKRANNRYGKERVKQTSGEVSGDFEGWDIYQGTLIGNKYIVNWGLMPNALRDMDDMGRPLQPIRYFCSSMALGTNKCVVSRLKMLQDELDRLQFKIVEMTGSAFGKTYVVNGNKLDVTSTELFSDLKIMKIAVIKGTSGEIDDENEGQKLIETIDLTLDPNIIRYVELKREQEREMNEIVSTSDISLGQQRTTIGKAVQENTVAQNTYGAAPLIWGTLKHFEDIIQYNVNLKQLRYSMSDSIDESLTIGDKGSYLLKILDPKEFGTQKFRVYLELNSALDNNQKDRIKSLALAAAQNGQMSVIDYIQNIEMAKSSPEMLKGMKLAEKRKKTEAQKNAQAGMQHEADLGMQQMEGQYSMQQNKEDNANYRAELASTTELVKEMKVGMDALLKTLSEQPPLSPLTTNQQQQ